MYELWHRVAIFQALEARGWRPLPPTLDAGYVIGETHHFARGPQLLRLDIVAPPSAAFAGTRALEEAVATVEPGAASFHLRLERLESARWRLALDEWAERASRRG